MLNKQTLLERTNYGFEIFRFYIPTKWQLGKNFLNPLYADNKASCNIYFDRKSRTYKMKDFGNDEYSGDCFSFVGKLKGLNCNNSSDFVEILKTINRDLSLGLSEDMDNTVKVGKPTPTIIPEKKLKPYSYQEQRLTAGELQYWQQYGISPDLLAYYKVCSVREFHSENTEGKAYSLFSSPEEPIGKSARS